MIGAKYDMDRTYCYEGSNVLKNKLNIRDLEELHTAERQISSQRVAMIKKLPVKGNFDFEHLKSLHKTIFGDIYEWAGVTREVNIAKRDMFCNVMFIDDMANDIFSSLKKDHYLLGCGQEEVSKKLSYYFGEINALHPFREGNGRSQREFMISLASVAGYELNFKDVDQTEMLHASIESFNTNYEPMQALIEKCIQPMTYKQQLKMCENMSLSKGSFKQEYVKYFNYINKIADNITDAGYKSTDDLIKKMESLNKKANKMLSIKDVHEIIKREDASDLKELASDIGKVLAKQELKEIVIEPTR